MARLWGGVGCVVGWVGLVGLVKIRAKDQRKGPNERNERNIYKGINWGIKWGVKCCLSIG